MTTHYMHLNSRPFDMVANGEKCIESRLNDEKRQTLEMGDVLTFVNRLNKEELDTTITALHRYDSFAELFACHDPHKFGGHSAEELGENIREFYSREDEQKYGVVGIEFEINRR